MSKEFIQNCYGGMYSANTPKYYAMYGDNFGDEQDSVTNILFGPAPNYGYSLRVTGTAYAPSLYQSASAGPADSVYTYISQWYPDLLIMAAMVYVSAFQRQFSSTSDDTEMAMTYEKQYQALRLGAVPLENRRKGQGSGWSPYSTPIAATPTRCCLRPWSSLSDRWPPQLRARESRWWHSSILPRMPRPAPVESQRAS